MVAGRVAIDMLAGPSECLVIADDAASPVKKSRESGGLTDIAAAGLSEHTTSDDKKRQRVAPHLPVARPSGSDTAPPRISRTPHAVTAQQAAQIAGDDETLDDNDA